MIELRPPLRDRMVTPLPEADARRLWRGIRARRSQGRARSRPISLGGLVGTSLALLLLLVGVFVHRAPAAPGVAFADGRDFVAIEGPTDAGAVARLSDGSTLSLDPGAGVRVLENGGTSLALLLESGRVRFEVKKGGPRRWVIECGLLAVEVVGTSFVITRTPERVRVDVEEGVVLARSDRLPDRVRRLVAGDSVIVGTDVEARGATVEPASSTSGAPSAEAAVVLPAPRTPHDAPAAPPREPIAGWRELAKRQNFADAYEALGAGGVAHAISAASVDDLFALADVARISGHPAEAVAPLQRISDEHGDDRRAPLAVFTLGRILLNAQPAQAARRFEQAISMGLPDSLVEDARAHIFEARARAGDRDGARAGAARYLAAYPQGRHVTEARAVAEAR